MVKIKGKRKFSPQDTHNLFNLKSSSNLVFAGLLAQLDHLGVPGLLVVLWLSHLRLRCLVLLALEEAALHVLVLREGPELLLVLRLEFLPAREKQ